MASENGIKSTADLRKMLLDTIADVRSGTIDAKNARTIAAISTTILQSAKLDLDFLRFHAANQELKDTGDRVLSLIAS
jgi:hypothetical protein